MGLEVTWTGDYLSNANWSGFKSVIVYASTKLNPSRSELYKVIEMTVNRQKNVMIAAADGSIFKLCQVMYLHASSTNLSNPSKESAIAYNVAQGVPQSALGCP